MIIKTKFKIYPCVFIHIPKCAGSSIKVMLQDLNLLSDIHSKLKDDIQILKNKEIDPRIYFIFTVLRNPWDRMVSYYFFYRDIAERNEEITKKAKKFDFKDWVSYIYENPKSFSFIDDNCLDYLTYKNKVMVDFTINFHNLSEDIDYLKNILHLKLPTLHVNSSKHDFYKDYYSEKEVEIISKIYKKDIDYFNFDFEKTTQMNKIINEEKINIIRSKKITLL